MRFKKGELTTTQIVTVIILIMSFAVILFFLYRLGFQSENQKEICRNSVELKAKDILGVSSLNCKTEYFCITEKDKCSQDSGAEIVRGSKVEISKKVGDSAYDCFWQYGEGEKKFVDWSFFNYVGDHKACGICSKFSLNGVSINKEDALSYISSNKDLVVLKNSLEILENLDKDFTVLYEVEQNSEKQYVRIVPEMKINDEKCETFFNLA